MTRADSSAALAELSGGLLNGLRSLHVFSNTGQGRSMPSARDPVRAAWEAREQLFTAAQRRQLEGFVTSSKNFATLLEERSPSPQPVRRDYVPAPRQQPKPREKKQQQRVSSDQEEAAGEQPEQPRLSKRQLKKMQEAQREEEEQAAAAAAAAAARAQQASQQAQLQAMRERRAAEDLEAARKRYKLTIRLGGGGSSQAGQPAAPPPAGPKPPPPAGSPPPDAALAAALDDHWRWHAAQRQQQQLGALPPDALPTAAQQQQWQPQEPAPLLPPLPAEEGPAGWQAAGAQLQQQPQQVPEQQWGKLAGPPLSPMSAPSSPLETARQPAAAANGGAQLQLNLAAVEHAADGSPAIQELLGTRAKQA